MKNDILVTNEEKGVRLDKFLVGQLHECTRGEIARMITSGAALVNEKKVKPSYNLKGGEKIVIGEYVDKSENILPNKNILLDIVENTPQFVVISKNQGVQVHPSHRERKKTLVNGLLAKFPEIKDVGDDPERPGIVHRLDKDTTGLLVVAKEQNAFDALKDAFKEKTVKKTYHSLVFGHFSEKEGVIDAPIARATSYTKQKIAFGKYRGDARDALTKYQILEEYQIGENALSLVEVQPQTGRTHQIRVHMAHIGHPLLGDQRYYTKNERKIHLEIPEEYDTETFYLHAKELSFTLNGEEYVFSAPYPDRFNALVRYLQAFKV